MDEFDELDAAGEDGGNGEVTFYEVADAFAEAFEEESEHHSDEGEHSDYSSSDYGSEGEHPDPSDYEEPTLESMAYEWCDEIFDAVDIDVSGTITSEEILTALDKEVEDGTIEASWIPEIHDWLISHDSEGEGEGELTYWELWDGLYMELSMHIEEMNAEEATNEQEAEETTADAEETTADAEDTTADAGEWACWANGEENEAFCESGAFMDEESCNSNDGRCHWDI